VNGSSSAAPHPQQFAVNLTPWLPELAGERLQSCLFIKILLAHDLLQTLTDVTDG
jgi:hypothetical protein